MKLSRVMAIARKETLHIVRDSRSLYLALGIPAMMLVLFGYALSLDVDNIPLAVWDQDRTPESRDLIDRITSSGYFRQQLYVNSYKEMVGAIDRRDVTVGLTIPASFAKKVGKEQRGEVQALVDGSDSTRAGIAINYLEVILSIYRDDMLKLEMGRQAVPRVEVPLKPRIRLLYNPELKSKINIIPGLIAIIMMVIAALLTSLTIVRERESGTMEQLISTPVRADELIVGKLIPYFVLGYIDLAIVYLMSQYVFGVPFRGNLALMFLLSGLFLAGSLSIGLMISAFSETQVFATQFALLGSFLPSFILSGFVFPISNMPEVIRIATYIVPARYYVVILRGIYLKGVGLEALAFQVVMLIVFALLTTAIAVRGVKKEL